MTETRKKPLPFSLPPSIHAHHKTLRPWPEEICISSEAAQAIVTEEIMRFNSSPNLTQPHDHSPVTWEDLRTRCRHSHPVTGGQPLLERERELLWELGPLLLPVLVLKPVEDLVEHLLQIRLKEINYYTLYTTLILNEKDFLRGDKIKILNNNILLERLRDVGSMTISKMIDN